MRIALTHRTQYRYQELVSLGPHIVRLRPAPHCRTPVASYSLGIEPHHHFVNWQQDPFANFVARVLVPDQTRVLAVTVDLVADMTPINAFDFYVDPESAHWPFSYAPALAADLAPYLAQLPAGPEFERYCSTISSSPRTTVEFIGDVNRKLCADVAYRTRMEAGVQTPEETLATRSGSCRDTAWLLVQVLRRFGLAARFVSGYLIQLRPPDAPAGAREDFADLHAWAETYIPGAGWIGLDPTSGLLADEGHIPLAATPSPASAAPIEGTHGVTAVDFSVTMQVERLQDKPPVARPYDERQWREIIAAGEAVDARLEAGDVRLSMGGEPTFVAADDRNAPEWNLSALGPTKRVYGDKLARALRERFAPGGLLHYGEGKWYPGEPAARWSHAIYWRRDGVPLWRRPELFASVEEPDATIAATGNFVGELCRELGLPADSAIPAYEDAAHYMLIERKAPIGVAPGEGAFADAAERERVLRAFDRGLDTPTGYVLPLLVRRQKGNAKPQFLTERWAFRRGHLFLVPGSSPMGLRLPLLALPEISFVDYPHVLPADPFADPRPLPSADLCREAEAGKEEMPAAPPDRDLQLVRTALAVELREGHVCVFLPPVSDGEDYAALVGAIEAAAVRTSQHIRIEGYAPPADPRLAFIKVTPDPGVLEVNVQPASTWKETVAITATVYEEAAKLGLGAEKFGLDGRELSTGGGGHIVVGGMRPADSPFLRRPDLLGSVIAYWQNHPSLSYMFAGQFVGPTSQAPRSDEARHEQLYELEIALAQVPEPGGAVEPWLIDRLFRNLLVDVSGNTHRAEICIDKLYAPEGPMGRLGLVEFRAFEMPPHARMGLAQQLLVRALLAWFWEQPYRKPLVRWGTTLHDRFMLPHVLWNDFSSILGDLKNAGLPLREEWFVPHFEFRFPVLGTVGHDGVAVELRRALEPWLVLGEQSGAGTTRTVDSSLERVQVRVTSDRSDRYAVTCNGYALPLAPTELSGEGIAGVRFRAWRTSEGFHPRIAPHVPLTFDIVDAWSGRSIGGCRYHVSHPGGLAFNAPPVNALEARARRRALFESIGHSAGRISVKTGATHPDFPCTLDLRRAGLAR